MTRRVVAGTNDRPNRRLRSTASSALDGSFELLNFVQRQVAKFAGVNVQRERAVANAFQFFHVVSGLLKHRPHLAIAALNQRDLVPRVLRLVHQLNSGWRGAGVEPLAVGKLNAGTKLLERGIAGLAADFHEICFWNVRRCFGQGIGQFSVVGQQQQPFAGVIEAAHRVNALLDAAQQIDNRRAPFRIAQRGHIAFGLVQQDVDVVV